MNLINTTTRADVEAARRELVRLRDGLNAYDARFTAEERCEIARADEALDVARSVLGGAAFALGRIRRRHRLGEPSDLERRVLSELVLGEDSQ